MGIKVDVGSLEAMQEFYNTNNNNFAQLRRFIASDQSMLNDSESDIRRAFARVYGAKSEKKRGKNINVAGYMASEKGTIKKALARYDAILRSRKGQYYERSDFDDYDRWLNSAQKLYGTTFGYQSAQGTQIKGQADLARIEEEASGVTGVSETGEEEKTYEVDTAGGMHTYTESEVESMLKGEMQPVLNAIEDYYSITQSPGPGQREIEMEWMKNKETGDILPVAKDAVDFGDNYESLASEAWGDAINAWREGEALELETAQDTETGEAIKATEGTFDLDSPNNDRFELYTPEEGTVEGEAVEGVESGEVGTGEVTEETTDLSADLQAAKDEAKGRLEEAYDNGLIGYDEYLFYSDAVDDWEAGEEVNFTNILSEFDKLQSETIDPYYAQQLEVAKSTIQASQDYLDAQRSLQVESQDVSAQEKLRSAKQTLESAGMTFTGEAARQLGAESVYTTEDTDTGLGTLRSLGEGLIPQENRMIATSSEAEYEENLRQLASETEMMIGTEEAQALGLETMGTTEPISGSIAEEKESLEKSTLSGLYSQATGNEAQGEYLNLLS